jgi:hypothetical protein
MNLIELSHVFEPTKGNIDTLAQQIADYALDGNDPLQLAVNLSAIIQTCELAKEKMSEAVLAELDKYPKGKTTSRGAKVERKEVGSKYDYTRSEAWVKIKEVEEKVSTKRKEVEAICKNCPEGSELQYTDTDTGEVLTITRASKTSTTSFAITLSK